MADPRTPIFKNAAPTDAGVSITFAAEGKMGAAYIINRGANDVYFAFDAIPANTDGDGRALLPKDQALNLDDIVYTTIGFRAPAGLATIVDVIGLPRPGSSSTGF